MHKSERGDDVNIMVAEKVCRTVQCSKSIAGREGDFRTTDPSISVDDNSIEYDCVRISPSFMEFKDACEGMTFRQLFIIQNIGKHAAHVRIGSPNSIAFQVKTLRAGVLLSPGLRILRWVHYSYKRTSVLHAMIPIYINRKYIDYHVICTLAKANLSIEPTSLDFGLVDIGSTSGIRMLTLRNDGGKSTRFAIDLGPNEMDLSVKPLRGILRARSRIILRVELIGVEEGTFFGEFWIKSTPNMRVPVNVNIIIPRLIGHHPNTTGDFTLIDFPLTFTNTTKHDTIILRSLSAQVSNFVVLGEIDNDLIPFKQINLKKHPAFQVFTIYPLEGRMDPFEGRVFNITFSPTGKVIKETEEFRKRDRQDFMVFVRIFRVHCTEIKDIVRKEMSLEDRADEPLKNVQLLEPDSAESLEMSDSEPPESPGETVRLCLYGETEETRLDFVPNALHFGNMTIGEVSRRELTIINPSNSASVVYNFVPNIAAHCEPTAGKIVARKSVQVLMTVTGNYNVTIPFKLTFNVLIQTCDLTSLKASSMMAKSCCILGWYTLIIPRSAEDEGKKPPDTLPLVPKKNRQRILTMKDDNLLKVSVDKKLKVGNNLLALPRSLDCEYALSPEEAAFKSYHRLYWSNYLRLRRKEKEATALKRLIPITSAITDCKDLLTAKLPKIKEQSITQELLRKSMDLKVGNIAKDEVLIPLSPLQIFNVKIAPTVLAYGLVAPKSMNYRTLHMENFNDFPVMLHLFSRVSKEVTFINGSSIILQPGSRITKIVEYGAQRIGKFNTYIDYVINNNHSFAMTVTATVVLKSLNLKSREITFGQKHMPLEAYQPLASSIEIKNKLDATISFTWDLRLNASFSIYPMSGEVRGNRSLFAEICHEPIISSHEVVLISESGAWTNLKLNTILKKPNVVFINSTLDLDKIPLNIMTTAIGVLHNAEFTEVMFQVDQSSLIYGCEVYPHHGIIPPRGIVNIEVRLRFDACFKFSITVDVKVQQSLNIELKIIGQVSYPMLKISPETISLQRISADALATHFLNASNTGQTVFRVQFPLEEYPEYHASLSPCRSDPALDTEGVTIWPDTSVSIYLHFIPTDLTSYSFYLPIVINEILGPVLMGNPKTMKPADFLKPRELHYVDYSGIEISELPPTIPTVFIDCTVSGHVISFSKHIFNFDIVSNKMKDELRVCNESNQEVSFIVRIDDFCGPKSPFSITWLSGVEPTITPLSIVCTMQQREEIFFLIEFMPAEQGIFKIEAPIFVRGELDGNMFNSLLLTGTNLVNCIVCNKTELYFAPVPLAVEAEQKLTLKINRCQDPTEIKAVVIKPEKYVGTYSNDCIQAKFLGSNFITGENSSEELEVSVIFRSSFPVALRTYIEFHVTDVVGCIINIYVIADNCILTTYGLLRSTTEAEGTGKRHERICSSSITSRGEDSSSLTKQDSISPRKRHDTVSNKFAMHPRVSGISQRSLKTPLCTDWKLEENEDEKSEVYDDDNFEGVSLKSKASDSLPPILDQSLKLFRAVYPNFAVDNYMQRTLIAAEQWMYSGGFKFNFYPSFVNGITSVLSGLCIMTSRSTEKNGAHTVSQSFIDLLITLAGADVLRYIGDTSHPPVEPAQRVRCVLKLYDNILNFLAVQGAFLPHVQSKFLLSYNDYLLIDTQNKSSAANYPSLEFGKSIQNDKMSKEMFQSRSKQCWLDLTLQTFKNLVLKRIRLKNIQDSINSFSDQSDPSNFCSSVSSVLSILEDVAKKISVEENPKYITKATNEETMLLSWLQHHFDQQQLEGWLKNDQIYLNPYEKRDSLQSRTVSNFDRDLADSLVLIAVTAAHCPYLIDDYFKNIYIVPRNVEELHHNAVCLTSAWQRIRLGFIITPGQIIRTNSVQMLILVTHLFQTLPTYLPSTKIEFCCPLTKAITRQISFTNTTEFPVSYVVEFIANQMNLFTAVIPQTIVNLKARSAGSLKIRYHARKIAGAKAYVILCGSSIAPNFARNHVFVLEGCTSFLGITNDYNIDRMLYQVCNEILDIPVPYKEATEYDISITEEQPTVPVSLKISRWTDLKTRKVPRRLFLNQNTILVKDNSYQADLSITITCIAPIKRSFWIVFESGVGDFIIQINSTSKKTTTDYIAVEWDREACTCVDLTNGISSTCPLNIKIPIPARNVQLWNCVNEMFQKTLHSKECSFWSRHIDTNIGLRLIHWLMGDYHDLPAKEFMHIFKTSVTYDVAVNNHENLIVPKKFVIHDVRPREQKINMMVHILESTPQNYSTTMNLSSPDGMEYRIYKFNFIYKTLISPAVISKTNNHVKKENTQR